MSSTEMKFTKKMKIDNKIILKNLDIRSVYIDNRATEISEATDQIYIERISIEQFKDFKYNKAYKNIDKAGTVWDNLEDKPFLTKEETGEPKQQVELLHYWNNQADKYVILANRNVIIREHPSIFRHKMLPITPVPLFYNDSSMY